MVKNPPYNAGDVGSIPGQGTKIPYAMGQLSPHATTTELGRLNKRARVPQTTEATSPGACAPQLERENPHTTTGEKPTPPTRLNKRSRMPQQRFHVPQLRPDAAKSKLNK